MPASTAREATPTAPGLSGEHRHVLIALSGHSPAVITETVWALARRNPKILPSHVVAITTRTGRDCIDSELFDSGTWAHLKKVLHVPRDSLRFGPSSDAVRVFPSADRTRELDDILESPDNVAAADFILETLRQFTENPDVRVVLSIAGGRKTMSVLAALCLTLLGRPEDTLCHVLVNPPFDRADLEPRFYFPDPEIPVYRVPDALGVPETITGKQARITLAQVPYVRFRKLFNQNFNRLPGGYMGLVAAANADMDRLAPAPELVLNSREASCQVNGVPVSLNELQFLLVWVLAGRRQNGSPPVRSAKTLQKIVTDCAAKLSPRNHPWITEARVMLRGKDPDYARKIVSQVHDRLKNSDLPRSVVEQLRLTSTDRRGLYALTIPPSSLTVVASSTPVLGPMAG